MQDSLKARHVKTLACDTALGALSAAVLEDARVLGHEFVEMSRGHAEALAPMVERVMRDAGVAFASLDRLAVTTGPGTFTGQRVGLAFMRAAALALKKPLIGVTTLEAMAIDALARVPSAWALVVADAKRGEVYVGALSASGIVLREATLVPAEAAVAVAVAIAREKGAPALAGTASDMVRESLRAHGIAATASGVRQPDAVFVARLAMNKPMAAAPPKPLYLRAPDAKLPS
jgi:tRNA threonylcarbamoyladenosine biosynthesis protein TsaB